MWRRVVKSVRCYQRTYCHHFIFIVMRTSDFSVKISLSFTTLRQNAITGANLTSTAEMCCYLQLGWITQTILRTHLFLRWPRAPFDTEEWRLWPPWIERTAAWAALFCRWQPLRSALVYLHQLGRCATISNYWVPTNMWTSLNITPRHYQWHFKQIIHFVGCIHQVWHMYETGMYFKINHTYWSTKSYTH